MKCHQAAIMAATKSAFWKMVTAKVLSKLGHTKLKQLGENYIFGAFLFHEISMFKIV